MQEIILTPSTIVLLALIIALAILAIYRMVKRGLCDCGDHCDKGCGKRRDASQNACGSCKSCGSDVCKTCATADKMVASIANDK